MREIPEAHPAEVGVALLAVDVVAPPVFVDRHLALGAVLRVGLEPVAGLGVVAELLAPILHIRTLCWCVPLVLAHEAPLVPLCTHDPRAKPVEVEVVLHPHRVRAVRRGTPLDSRVAVDVLVDQHLLVLFEEVGIAPLLAEQLLDNALVHHDRASPHPPLDFLHPRAVNFRRLALVFDLDLEMASPTVVAEKMPARFERSHRRVCLAPLKRVAAQRAHPLLLRIREAHRAATEFAHCVLAHDRPGLGEERLWVFEVELRELLVVPPHLLQELPAGLRGQLGEIHDRLYIFALLLGDGVRSERCEGVLQEVGRHQHVAVFLFETVQVLTAAR
mmetsp:Transcript_25181/g.60135  ORF Transcript_25181/g.60135 Transcript_25181/m.60135 type:complete len:331 (-) Transcript_25181:380-1372(-)